MNRKGFTLIELLATITLLGIILITTTNIILNVIDNSKKKTYNNQINRIESAAKIWAVKNTEKLPTLGQVYEVSFADLVKSGVLSNEEIVNPLNKKILKGCVYVTNQSDDYNYKYNENCSIQTFLVNYNLNGGTLDKENASFYDVTTETFILNNPSKNDYIFVGWTGSNGRIPQKTVSITKGSTGNKEYTANWETIEYAISYNLNGGTATNPVKYDVETNAFTLNNPNRIGYIFIGWTGANGTVPELSVTISSGSAGDRLYIANWFKSEYTITYNLNGGTATNPVKYNFEDNAFTLNNPNRTGYVFKGWTGANGTVPELSVTISSGSAGNRLYIANWMAIEYAISYNFNGGNISNNYTSYNVETATFTLNNPTKNNQIFIGWIGSNGTEPQTSVSVNKGSMGNKNYIANWANAEYIYDYTGQPQYFIVPVNGTYRVELWGAQGGVGGQGGCSGSLAVGGKSGYGGYINITINSTRGQQFAVIVGGIGENGYLGPHIAKGGYNGGQNGTPAGRSKGGTGTGGGGGGATSLVVNSINYAMANGGGGGGGGTDGGYFRYKSGPFIGETKCGGCRDRNEGAAGTKGGDGGGGTKGGAQASFTCLSDGNDGEHGSYYYNSSYVTLVSGQVGGKSGNGYAKITYIG